MHRMIAVALLAAFLPVTAVAQQANRGGATEFTVRITNVSTSATLKLSNGETAPAPTAPVLWVVHTGANPLFTGGEHDRGQGLEALAEDGNPATLASSLEGRKGIVAIGTVTVPVGAREPGPILPGNAFELTFTATPGQRLTLAMMFGQSNDLFYAPTGEGLALFDAEGKALTGDVTSRLILWDAGTEVNQEPGLGPDQAPRQGAPNTGTPEHGTVGRVSDAYTYPSVAQVIRVTVTSRPAMIGQR